MLKQMNIGATGTVTAIAGDRSTQRKLMALGIKTGSEVELLHHRGRGVVVRSNGTRIAIGEGIAEHVEVAPAQARCNTA